MSSESTDLSDFGGRLAEMRRAYGDRIDLPNLGTSAFATLIGVSIIEYETYERGDRTPTVDFLNLIFNKIAARLD